MSLSKKESNKNKLYKQLAKGLKVCRHCNSVLIVTQQFCSKCHKDVFIEDPEDIQKMLLRLSEK